MPFYCIFDGDYNRWRKLNLILQEVQKNYVDTIDIKEMTDAAVVAALGKLDPHSVYLPPVELTESETELAGNFEGIGITFMYSFLLDGKGILIFRTDNPERTREVIILNDLAFITDKDLSLKA